MRTALLAPLVLTLACTTTDADKDTDDTDTTGSDTEDTGDTAPDDTDDTDDTGPGDTDDTDTPTACVPTTPPSLTPNATEPTAGTEIQFTRTIEACADDDGITGQWWVEILDGTGALRCRYVSTFQASGSLGADGCTTCLHAFADASFSAPTRTNPSNCTLFGLDETKPGYVSGSRQEYSALGVTNADILHQHPVDGWVQIDPSMTDADATVTRTGADVGDTRKVTVTFETTYDY